MFIVKCFELFCVFEKDISNTQSKFINNFVSTNSFCIFLELFFAIFNLCLTFQTINFDTYSSNDIFYYKIIF